MRILVIQTAFIGDCVLTIPLIKKISEIYSMAEIDVVTTPLTSEIFQSIDIIKNVFILNKKGEHKSFRNLLSFAKELRKKKYSLCITPHRSFRSALLTFLINAENSIGFNTSSFPYFFKEIKKYDYTEHEIFRLLNLISNDKTPTFEFFEIKNENEKIKEIISQSFSTKRIAIAPGSEWGTKRLPINKYVDLINKFDKEIEIVLIGGKKDIDLTKEIIRNTSKNVKSFCGEFSLTESVLFLKYCKLLITNDSAPTHLGMWAGIPVLTIYCSTVPRFGFYPIGGKSDYISYDNLKCKPCGIHGYEECPLGNFNCAVLISVNEIFQKALKILNE